MSDGWVDIHCHLTPGIDDGAKSGAESIAMAQMAVAEGTRTVICTPHQLGNFRHNRGDEIRRQVQSLQELLNANRVPLVVLPGADVRIEDDMMSLLASGEVLTLGDLGKHVLLELPHDLYFPLESILDGLSKLGMVGILSHPERNRGILREPAVMEPLIDAGCLMQITTGSLTGSFGPDCQRLADQLVSRGHVHFLATDAHGAKARRPLIREAYARAVELAGEKAATTMCQTNPRLVAEGRAVRGGVMDVEPRRSGWRFWKRAS
ncbi:MAG: tyrosine-protein phosphatase [Aeoliella sp.]